MTMAPVESAVPALQNHLSPTDFGYISPDPSPSLNSPTHANLRDGYGPSPKRKLRGDDLMRLSSTTRFFPTLVVFFLTTMYGAETFWGASATAVTRLVHTCICK